MIYIRVSSDAEGRELGVSRHAATAAFPALVLGVELEDCTALAERHGWTIAREFRDNDRGGSTR